MLLVAVVGLAINIVGILILRAVQRKALT